MIWIGRLISLAVILQSIESFWITPWPWKIIEREVPALLRPLVARDRLVLSLRLLSAVAALILPHPILVAAMLIATWLQAIRWRGTFNGGSDVMTFHILLAWFATATVPNLELAAIFYITLHVILSFFVAGIAKAVRPEWRNGTALKIFLERRGISIGSGASAFGTRYLLVFELLSPLALLFPAPGIALALVFQLANVYVFGLNRFFFAWLAGFPAVFLAAKILSSK